MPVFYHILFVFALVSRLGDIGTTWLVTPTLKLEANPIMRKLRWPFAWVTLLFALTAYGLPEVCVMLTTVSFLVAGSNAMKIPAALALGEDAMYMAVITQAAKGRFWPGWLARIAPTFFYALLGAFIFIFFPTPDSWAYYIAMGICLYAGIYAFYGTLAYVRMRKRGWAMAKEEIALAGK